MVAQWLALVPVVALELGSALAGLLVQAVRVSETPLSKPRVTPLATEKDKVATAIVEHLKANGGAIHGSSGLRESARSQQKHDKPRFAFPGSVGCGGPQ